METTRGRYYRIEFSTTTLSDPNWIVGPLSARFPVDVVSVELNGPSGIVAVVRWAGPDGFVNEGDRVDGIVPGLMAATDVMVPRASVVSVTDLGWLTGTVAKTKSLIAPMLGAVLILGYVAYMAHKIGQGAEKALGKAFS